MRRKVPTVIRLGIMTAVLLLVAGCATSTGGGVALSANQEGAQATYGFQLGCNPNTNVISGQLEYQDHGVNETYPNGVAIHGAIPMGSVASYTEGEFTTCAQLDDYVTSVLSTEAPPLAGSDVFTGLYVPQQTAISSETGEFFVAIAPSTVPIATECAPNAAFLITLQGGAYGGYTNEFCVAPGNVTIH